MSAPASATAFTKENADIKAEQSRKDRVELKLYQCSLMEQGEAEGRETRMKRQWEINYDCIMDILAVGS